MIQNVMTGYVLQYNICETVSICENFLEIQVIYYYTNTIYFRPSMAQHWANVLNMGTIRGTMLSHLENKVHENRHGMLIKTCLFNITVSLSSYLVSFCLHTHRYFAVQNKKAVAAGVSSKQLQPFDFYHKLPIEYSTTMRKYWML